MILIWVCRRVSGNDYIDYINWFIIMFIVTKMGISTIHDIMDIYPLVKQVKQDRCGVL